MTTPHLPDDVARCNGAKAVPIPSDGIPAGIYVGEASEMAAPCSDCLRRTAPRQSPSGVWMAPPIGIDWLEQRCPYRIAP